MVIQTKQMDTRSINDKIARTREKEVQLQDVLGQRYLGNASHGKYIRIYGTAGNGLGSFLEGSTIEVFGNAQEACGDTMNEGTILIHGHCGDAAGYGMRGGRLFVRDNCGSRCGIHMKAYQDKQPVIVIGGCAKSFLGEYISGGTIVVLNRHNEAQCVGKYCGNGAHGGCIYLRMEDCKEMGFSQNEAVPVTDAQELANLKDLLQEYEDVMNIPLPDEMHFYKIAMQSKNPYEKYYVKE